MFSSLDNCAIVDVNVNVNVVVVGAFRFVGCVFFFSSKRVGLFRFMVANSGLIKWPVGMLEDANLQQ